MERVLLILCALVATAMCLVSYPDGAIAVLVTLLLSIGVVYLIRYYTEEKAFLTKVFIIALLARITLGLVIHIFDLRQVFGPDAIHYNLVGQRIVELWRGLPVPNDYITVYAMNNTDSGWGMNNFVAAIYYVCGQTILTAQSACAVIGAATAPMVYFCAERIFSNKRAAKLSAVAIALFPSFIVWSSQLIKDGIIIFLLVFAITMILQLQKKFGYAAVVGLILTLFGIMALRFYIFYMIAAAAAGSFLIGLETSVKLIVRNIVAVVLVGVALTYLGVLRNATTDIEQYGSLERIQADRQYLASSAKSGFGKDLDVSTAGGAVSALPISFSYLMFAPFPWQMDNIKMLFLLPEMLIWWLSIPILIAGLWYSLKYKFRSAVPILIFSLMLTIAYSIFQGNLGMAYRQRTQIQVFLFVFISVGWTTILERRENQKMLRDVANTRFKRNRERRENLQNLQQEKV